MNKLIWILALLCATARAETIAQYLQKGIPISQVPITPTLNYVMVGNGTSFICTAQPALDGTNFTNLNGAALMAASVPDSALNADVTIQSNTFNGASQLVQLDGSTRLPAVNASLLTNLNPANITGPISIGVGGTGGTTAATARNSLGAGRRGNAFFDVTTWASRTAAAANQWQGICWSPELSLFCAVSVTGTSRVMTSPDGINWTSRTASEANAWNCVCWSPELRLFCAVSYTGTNRVMTSPNGITWTARAASAARQWNTVCWSPSLLLFCAVCDDGVSGSVMTSPDGTTWTTRTAAASNAWGSICWSPELTLFCAVSADGTSRVMTSPNGTTWTSRTAAAANGWQTICWSPELSLFCALSYDGTNRVMTSPNGTSWTARSASVVDTWNSICWSPELLLFCAVGTSGTNAMTSPDGTTWTTRTIPAGSSWYRACWSPELSLFCIVASTGTTQVTTSQNAPIVAPIDASLITTGGTIPANSGVNLTALNATNLGSGTVPDARFPATLPAASGVNLTALNATNLGSGTIADARQGSNVGLINQSKDWTSQQSFSVTGTAKTILSGSGIYHSSDTGDYWKTLTDVGMGSVDTGITRSAVSTIKITDGAAGTGTLVANLSATNLTTGTAGVGIGGTGLTTYAVGDIMYASGATTLSKLADIATGNVLLSGGVTTAPSYGKVGLTTHVSGTLGYGNGGSGATAFTNHGVVVAGASALSTVAPGTSGNVLTSNGTDFVSSAPAGGGPTYAFRTVDGTAINNSSSLTADGVLTFTALANKTYLITGTLRIQTTTAASVNVGFGLPSGTIVAWDLEHLASGSGNINCNFTTGNNSIGFFTNCHNTAQEPYRICAVFANGATPGTVDVKLAQAFATAVDTTMKAGSFIRIELMN